METSTLREAQLDEQIRRLEREVSNLGDQIAALEVEKAQMLARASSSHTSAFLDVLRYLYEIWIPTEAQLNIFKNLITAGKVPEADFEDARVKTRVARIVCGYDPSTLGTGEEEENWMNLSRMLGMKIGILKAMPEMVIPGRVVNRFFVIV